MTFSMSIEGYPACYHFQHENRGGLDIDQIEAISAALKNAAADDLPVVLTFFPPTDIIQQEVLSKDYNTDARLH